MQPLHSDNAAMKLLIYNVPMFVIPLTLKDKRGGVECTFLCLKPELESTVSSTYGVNRCQDWLFRVTTGLDNLLGRLNG